MEATGPNAQQIEYWNDSAAAKWVAQAPLLDAQLAPLGLAALERAAPRAGERVLDVGCGCGQTVLQLAERVGPGGRVFGIDVSQPMLARARERALELACENVEFAQGDAQTQPFPESSFDLVFSRFGVMFFSDPAAAFANLRRALRADGRIVFVCWQELGKNPWMQVPVEAALTCVPPPERAAPGAPGPFAFADAERVQGCLRTAGFRGTRVEALERPVLLGGGGTLDDALGFLLQVGPMSALLKGAEPELRRRVRDAVERALGPYVSPEGVRLGSASWIVRARP